MAIGLLLLLVIGVVGIVGLFAAGYLMNRSGADNREGDR